MSDNAVRALDAAKTLAHYLEWEVSNLKMQKVLYMAQMLYMGEQKTLMEKDTVRLIDAEFLAWPFGPVILEVYEHLKVFDVHNIEESALKNYRVVEGEQGSFFKGIARTFADFPPFELVEMTHDPKGAWAKHYTAKTKGKTIPDEDIQKEFLELYLNGGEYWKKENVEKRERQERE